MARAPQKLCETCGKVLARDTQGTRCAAHRIRTRLPRRSCATCGKELSRETVGDYCKHHRTDDREAEARRIARLRERFRLDPALADGRRKWLSELNRSPEARARASQQAHDLRLWEFGLPKMTPEVRARQAATLRERRLAHVPIEYRGLYAELQGKGLSAAEAFELIQQQFAAAVQRHTARIIAARKARERHALGDIDL